MPNQNQNSPLEGSMFDKLRTQVRRAGFKLGRHRGKFFSENDLGWYIYDPDTRGIMAGGFGNGMTSQDVTLWCEQDPESGEHSYEGYVMQP
ncbi:hypothetical protein OAK38_09005 [Verrucomicrobia bacterium]|nr:hypothetical protein [Verrucomicrobiota bacterium]